MPRESRSLTILGRLVYPMALGVIGGGVAGLAEFAVMLLSGDRAVAAPDLLPYVILYAVIWGAIGLGLGVVLGVVTAARRPPPDAVTLRSLAVSLMLTGLVLGSLGAYVNVQLLPGMLAWPSLLFDLALLVGCVFLARALFQAMRRRIVASRSAPRLRSPLVVFGLAFVVVLVVGALIPAEDALRASGTAGETPRDMNILLVVVDALRADHLGCYGYERDVSRNVDRIAREGVIFTSAYAQAPVTKHSTATLVTSLFPSSHGVRGISDGLPEDTPVLMEEMRNLGYRTAVLSANALVSPLFGFGRGTDLAFSGTMPMSQKSLQGRTAMRLSARVPGMRWVPAALAAIDRRLPRSGESLSPYEEQAEVLNAMLLSWIDAAPEARFFAYVHYMEPHMPLVAPPPFDTMFDPGYAGKVWSDFPVYKAGILPFNPGPSLPERERTNLIARYDGTIAYFDHEFGKLLNALEARGIGRNTLIVITSDHGEEFYDHRGWGHGISLFEELIRVPLIAWCPERVPGGRRIEHLVRHVDIMPTLLAAAGAHDEPRYAEFEGRNLWPALTEDEELGPEVPVFSECSKGEEAIRALRVGSEKLIHALSGGRELVMLFDLSEDPREMNDLSAERPEVRKALTAWATDIQAQALNRQKTSEERTMDESTKETLRALGYIQ
jgi:arylsulfatase A-like enzyme